jgi:hypothetical protein
MAVRPYEHLVSSAISALKTCNIGGGRVATALNLGTNENRQRGGSSLQVPPGTTVNSQHAVLGGQSRFESRRNDGKELTSADSMLGFG